MAARLPEELTLSECWFTEDFRMDSKLLPKNLLKISSFSVRGKRHTVWVNNADRVTKLMSNCLADPTIAFTLKELSKANRNRLIGNIQTLSKLSTDGKILRVTLNTALRSFSILKSQSSCSVDPLEGHGAFTTQASCAELRKADIALLSNGESVPCHAVVLAELSEYFVGLFEGGWQSVTLDERTTYTMTAYTKHELEKLVEFAYTGALTLDYNSVDRFLEMAREFFVPGMTTLCTNYMLRTLNCETALKYYFLATEYALPELLEACCCIAKEEVYEPPEPCATTLPVFTFDAKEYDELSSHHFVVDGVFCAVDPVVCRLRAPSYAESFADEVLGFSPTEGTLEQWKLLHAFIYSGEIPKELKTQDDAAWIFHILQSERFKDVVGQAKLQKHCQELIASEERLRLNTVISGLLFSTDANDHRYALKLILKNKVPLSPYCKDRLLRIYTDRSCLDTVKYLICQYWTEQKDLTKLSYFEALLASENSSLAAYAFRYMLLAKEELNAAEIARMKQFLDNRSDAEYLTLLYSLKSFSLGHISWLKQAILERYLSTEMLGIISSSEEFLKQPDVLDQTDEARILTALAELPVDAIGRAGTCLSYIGESLSQPSRLALLEHLKHSDDDLRLEILNILPDLFTGILPSVFQRTIYHLAEYGSSRLQQSVFILIGLKPALFDHRKYSLCKMGAYSHDQDVRLQACTALIFMFEMGDVPIDQKLLKQMRRNPNRYIRSLVMRFPHLCLTSPPLSQERETVNEMLGRSYYFQKDALYTLSCRPELMDEPLQRRILKFASKKSSIETRKSALKVIEKAWELYDANLLITGLISIVEHDSSPEVAVNALNILKYFPGDARVKALVLYRLGSGACEISRKAVEILPIIDINLSASGPEQRRFQGSLQSRSQQRKRNSLRSLQALGAGNCPARYVEPVCAILTTSTAFDRKCVIKLMLQNSHVFSVKGKAYFISLFTHEDAAIRQLAYVFLSHCEAVSNDEYIVHLRQALKKEYSDYKTDAGDNISFILSVLGDLCAEEAPDIRAVMALGENECPLRYIHVLCQMLTISTCSNERTILIRLIEQNTLVFKTKGKRYFLALAQHLDPKIRKLAYHLLKFCDGMSTTQYTAFLRVVLVMEQTSNNAANAAFISSTLLALTGDVATGQ